MTWVVTPTEGLESFLRDCLDYQPWKLECCVYTVGCKHPM